MLFDSKKKQEYHDYIRKYSANIKKAEKAGKNLSQKKEIKSHGVSYADNKQKN